MLMGNSAFIYYCHEGQYFIFTLYIYGGRIDDIEINVYHRWDIDSLQ